MIVVVIYLHRYIFKISAYYTIYKSDFGDEVVKKQLLPEPVYAVIIDAGSTGSRVLALAFKKTPSKKKHLLNIIIIIFNTYIIIIL